MHLLINPNIRQLPESRYRTIKNELKIPSEKFMNFEDETSEARAAPI